MKLQNNAQKVNLPKNKKDHVDNTEDYETETRCQISDFAVLHFPEYKNYSKNRDQHHLLFSYILVANDIDIELFHSLIGLFETCKKNCNHDTRYMLFNSENCKVVDFQFDKLINSINIHLDDCAKLNPLENNENIKEIAIDFIDTQNVFLNGVLPILKSSKLKKLQMDVILSNKNQQTITKYYYNVNHEIEKFILKYIEEMNILVSDMIMKFNLKSYHDDFETINKFNQITESGLEMLMEKLGQEQIIYNENINVEYEEIGENVFLKHDFNAKLEYFSKNVSSMQNLNNSSFMNANEHIFVKNSTKTEIPNINNTTSKEVIANNQEVNKFTIALSVLGSLFGVLILCITSCCLFKWFKKKHKEEQSDTYVKYEEIEMPSKNKK